MQKLYTIKKNPDFKKVYGKGRSVAGYSMVLYYLPVKTTGKRFGFSVGKKVGKAVVRNRVKRVLKELCRLNQQWFKEGYDYILIPRKGFSDRSFQQLRDDLGKLTGKAFKNEGK
ncbi:ribonuclease P protein component [Desulfocucumis palustris]|uniref:Ribonuclease P protein component n=1 Tax=Desulfocucumis palustris TaxID=1898651 RepID=A0A2L2X909_9FIRM|nr:ribonuclease P protein component [Desulfocucumis palustris]GBF32510.1 ribonuclease P protein component [Desulfocucumis palustris]